MSENWNARLEEYLPRKLIESSLSPARVQRIERAAADVEAARQLLAKVTSEGAATGLEAAILSTLLRIEAKGEIGRAEERFRHELQGLGHQAVLARLHDIHLMIQDYLLPPKS